ncbi:hypothetical protein F4824DRAFT_507772 [Ustulina deusta]|nr:hypothetical protein F4824DRAFT_507772 [Ustulina deusta]
MADMSTDKIPFGAFLYRNHLRDVNLRKKQEQNKELRALFASPRTLFCSGLWVDSIQETGVIDRQTGRDPDYKTFLLFLIKVRALHQQLLKPKEPAEPDGPLSELISPLAFFLLQEIERVRGGDWEVLVQTRFPEIAGRTYFITKSGFVGITTVAVRKSDSLAILGDVTVNFVLREVDDPKQSPAEAQIHQIVARAAVRDNDINIAIRCANTHDGPEDDP